jgi:REP element-mobilizing transposase RayT
MILGYHVIFSTYGFWLPNDPRGSWSQFVGSWELFVRAGRATKTTDRRSLAHDPHDRAARLEAKNGLKRPPVDFSGIQARAVGRGFGTYLAKTDVPVWACSVLPDHVHLVTGRLHISVERLVIQLKQASTLRLVDEGIHPFQSLKPPDGPPPKCWARGEWKVFLNTEEEVERAIRYVEDNPLKEGKPRQRWPFVRPRSAAPRG